LVFFVIVPLLLSGLCLSLWWIVLGFLDLFQTPTRKPPGPLRCGRDLSVRLPRVNRQPDVLSLLRPVPNHQIRGRAEQ
jgi:hypothetical protein